MRPQVLYEDSDVVVLDKPAGLSVHAGNRETPAPTVVDFIRGKVKDTHGERPGIVHRLDKDTSGVLVVARNPQTMRFLQKQFKDRKVTKTYIALVKGHPKHRQAIIELPIGRNSKNPLKRAVMGRGKAAQTRYKLIKEIGDYSLLELYPKTGRTHQIRVHLAHLGHPIVGDALYGKADPKLKRQFLHAHKLGIQLPNGERKVFMSPLPTELESYLSQL